MAHCAYLMVKSVFPYFGKYQSAHLSMVVEHEYMYWCNLITYIYPQKRSFTVLIYDLIFVVSKNIVLTTLRLTSQPLALKNFYLRMINGYSRENIISTHFFCCTYKKLLHLSSYIASKTKLHILFLHQQNSGNFWSL